MECLLCDRPNFCDLGQTFDVSVSKFGVLGSKEYIALEKDQTMTLVIAVPTKVEHGYRNLPEKLEVRAVNVETKSCDTFRPIVGLKVLTRQLVDSRTAVFESDSGEKNINLDWFTIV